MTFTRRQLREIRVGGGVLAVTYPMRGLRQYWPALRLQWLPEAHWRRAEQRGSRWTWMPGKWVRFHRAWSAHTL